MGGSSNTSSSVKVPAWLSSAAQDMLKQSQANAQIGYTPYYGPDVAAMTPAQIAAMTGTNSAASAFGLQTVDPMAGMPTATSYGGMNAYSSGAGYDAALAELKARFPGQFDAIMAQFIDPITGANPAGSSESSNQQARYPYDYGGGGNSRAGMGRPDPNNFVGAGPGGSGSLSNLASTAASYLPGGVNTRNPGSLLNTMAGTVRNAVSPQAAPTAANRPPTRPTVAVVTKPSVSKPVVVSAPRSTYF